MPETTAGALPEHTTTLRVDERGRINLARFVDRDKEYRLHELENGALLLRPVDPK